VLRLSRGRLLERRLEVSHARAIARAQLLDFASESSVASDADGCLLALDRAFQGIDIGDNGCGWHGRAREQRCCPAVHVLAIAKGGQRFAQMSLKIIELVLLAHDFAIRAYRSDLVRR